MVRRVSLLCGTLCLLLGPSGASASAWSDVSASVSITVTPEAVDGDVLFVDAMVENTGAAPLEAELRLVVFESSFAVLNADGTTGEAEPYFTIAAPLAPSASETVRIEFPILQAALGYSLRLEQLLPAVDPLVVTSPPTLTMDPVGMAPLAGIVEVTTNIPTRAALWITDTERTRKIAYPEWETSHELMVLGLEPESDYSLEVRLTDQMGQTTFAPPKIAVTTPALPADFPFVGVLASDPAAMEPGFLLVDKLAGISAGQYAIAFDAEGRVVWISADGDQAMFQLPNGNLFFRDGVTAVEMDMVGRRVETTPLQASDLHHDLVPTAHGTLLSLGVDIVPFTDYPTSETDPNAPAATQNVRDEPAMEFLPDGTLVGVWNARDMLDTSRIGYDSLLRCGTARACDWAHANAITHDPVGDLVVVSERHQDAVIAFHRSTGQLAWILGNHDNWSAPFQQYLLQPQGALEWQYHQHAPMVTGDGTLLVFDNGNRRASPFDGMTPIPDELSESRAVEFAIDAQNMTVEQVWEFRFPFEDRTYANFISDADSLPETGNVLVHFGGTRFIGGVSTTDLGLGAVVTRAVEVTRETPPTIVFEILIFDPASAARSYRSAKVKSLYPANVVITETVPFKRKACGLGSFETLAVVSGWLTARRRLRA